MDKLIIGAPLMPPIVAVLMFIGILSPVTWSVSGYIYTVFAVSVAISIVSAYCIVSFMENINR